MQTRAVSAAINHPLAPPVMILYGQVWGGIGARGGMCGRSINTRVHSGAECECKSSVDQFKVEQAPIVRSTKVCWTYTALVLFSQSAISCVYVCCGGSAGCLSLGQCGWESRRNIGRRRGPSFILLVMQQARLMTEIWKRGFGRQNIFPLKSLFT